MTPAPVIETDEDYRRYLAEVETLVSLDPERGTAAGARLDLLATLVDDYEKRRFPLEGDATMKLRPERSDDDGAHIGKGAAWLVWYVLACIAVLALGLALCSMS